MEYVYVIFEREYQRGEVYKTTIEAWTDAGDAQARVDKLHEQQERARGNLFAGPDRFYTYEKVQLRRRAK